MEYKVALIQGIYFFITGIWPIMSMNTFILITGPKKDLWLVKTVGLILAVIGTVLIYAQMTGTVNPPDIFLATGSASSLALVEIIYVLKRVISPVYLGDAFIQLVLISWLILSVR